MCDLEPYDVSLAFDNTQNFHKFFKRRNNKLKLNNMYFFVCTNEIKVLKQVSNCWERTAVLRRGTNFTPKYNFNTIIGAVERCQKYAAFRNSCQQKHFVKLDNSYTPFLHFSADVNSVIGLPPMPHVPIPTRPEVDSGDAKILFFKHPPFFCTKKNEM